MFCSFSVHMFGIFNHIMQVGSKTVKKERIVLPVCNRICVREKFCWLPHYSLIIQRKIVNLAICNFSSYMCFSFYWVFKLSCSFTLSTRSFSSKYDLWQWQYTRFCSLSVLCTCLVFPIKGCRYAQNNSEERVLLHGWLVSIIPAFFWDHVHTL